MFSEARHVLIDSQHHLDYLHKPENLFLAFCVLTTNGWQDFSDFENGQILQMQLPGEICRDIRALARLRPSDPSWDQCRRKLRDLQDDREEFFVKQQKWEWDELEDLTPEDIEQAKSNIHFAVEELDRFFSDWRNMKLRFLMHPHELISIMWRFPSRIYQNFRYPQHREGDEENVSS
ncbi:hypothetical protein IW261DRAFT_922347 [Armillaria novae-zelandiae]|uniref:Uncharacterized protein n=1 Tax=Armillaria novae-zelandiae TaxID=153914 RepID=A0AA39NS46_9AGAR|nr:hypothetical protein IW261DRAFT_922347 [Armillaria novae-zelandiae]